MKKFIVALFIVLSTANAEASMSSWSENDIKKATEIGIVKSDMQEYTDAITREEFCTLIINMLDSRNINIQSDIEITFSDTDNESVIKAAQYGIVNGVGNGKFNPSGKITRQEAAVILYNTLDKASDIISGYKADNKIGVNGIFFPHVFNDGKKINDWARNKIYAIYHLGIMLGNDGNFDPLGTYTKEQAVSTILRLNNAFDNTALNNMPEPEYYPIGENSHIYPSSDGRYFVDAIWQWGSPEYKYEPEYIDSFGNIFTAEQKGYVYPPDKKYMDILAGGPAGTGNEFIVDKACNQITDNCYNILFITDNIIVTDNPDGSVSVYNLDTKEYILNGEYDFVGNEAECGMYLINKNGLYGYLNSDFKEVIPPIYKFTGKFLNDLNVLQKQNGSFIIVNTKGEILKTFECPKNAVIQDICGTNIILHDSEDSSADTLYRAYSGISVKGYSRVHFTSNGDIMAEKDDKKYILDKSGNVKINLTDMGYESLEDNRDFYVAAGNDYADIIDFNGNIIRKNINQRIYSDGNGIWAYKSEPDNMVLFDSYGKDIGIIKTDNNYSSFDFINGIVRVHTNNGETKYYTPDGKKIFD